MEPLIWIVGWLVAFVFFLHHAPLVSIVMILGTGFLAMLAAIGKFIGP